MSKNEKCTCKACKNTVFHCQICKYVGVLLPSSSWLLKLSKISAVSTVSSAGAVSNVNVRGVKKVIIKNN